MLNCEEMCGIMKEKRICAMELVSTVGVSLLSGVIYDTVKFITGKFISRHEKHKEKKEIIQKINNEIYIRVKDYSKNKYELQKYYNVGKLLLEAGNQYGENIIRDYSIRLTNELGKGYSQRNLRSMRQFYKVSQKWQTVSAKLSWSHLCEILWFEDNKFLYYVKTTEE